MDNKKQIQARLDSGDLTLKDTINVISSNPSFMSGDKIEITYDKYGFYIDPTVKVTEYTVEDYLNTF